MTTTLELTSGAIRLCRTKDGRITALDHWPVPDGADPVAALSAVPLPSGLGRIRVVLAHDDLMLRALVQPPCPPERLDRLVHFELTSAADQDGPVSVSWHLAKSLPGDFRILALVAKTRLIDRLRQALSIHGARIATVTHPAIGLAQTMRAQEAAGPGPWVVLDVGGKQVHFAIVQDGELLFARSVSPGLDELVKAVAERRGVGEPDARKLIAKLGRGAPDDLKELVAKAAGQIALLITANLRFARAQLGVDKLEPQAVLLAGAGAQVHGFTTILAERGSLPVRVLNPFAGVLSSLPNDLLDRQAALPSPWTVAIGVSQTKVCELDGMADERQRQAMFWRSEGALKVAVALVAALLVIAIALQEVRGLTASATRGQLSDLVPKAEASAAKATALEQSRQTAATRVAWLDRERRSGRITQELLNAISQEQTENPVVLTRYRVALGANGLEGEIEGFARTSGAASTDVVLHRFADGLKTRYPTIVSLTPETLRPERDQLPFLYRIAFKE